MKRILVLRHGKADRTHFDKDYNRVLKNRGIDDSNRMGDFLKRRDFSVQWIIASGALRAKQTADIVQGKLQSNIPIQYDDRLYYEGVEGMLAAMQDVPDQVETLLFVGHNPSLEAFVSALVSDGSMDLKLSTCGLVLLTVEKDRWSDIRPNDGTLEWVLKPKLL